MTHPLTSEGMYHTATTTTAVAQLRTVLESPATRNILQWLPRFKSAQDKSIRDLRAVKSARPASHIFPLQIGATLASACHGVLLKRGTRCSRHRRRDPRLFGALLQLLVCYRLPHEYVTLRHNTTRTREIPKPGRHVIFFRFVVVPFRFFFLRCR